MALDKDFSTKRLIFSKSNYYKVWRHLLKVLDKIAFLQGRCVMGLQQRKEFITLRVYSQLLTPRPLLIFSTYQLLINTYSRIQFRGCGNLATSIGSSVKSFTSFILTVSNSLRSSKLFEYLKLSVPLKAERLNNRMHSCRSPGKLVRRVRELSEGFGFKHS